MDEEKAMVREKANERNIITITTYTYIKQLMYTLYNSETGNRKKKKK